MPSRDLYSSITGVFNKISVEEPSNLTQKIRLSSAKLQIQDILGIFTFWILLPICFAYEVIFKIEIWYPFMSKEWLIVATPLLLLGVNVYLNALMMVSVGPNNKLSDLPSVMRPGYKYCHNCQLNSPQRAYHCPTCDICIFRRDHHCSFAFTCVGHQNQRFFVAAVVNLWFISLFCTILNWSILLSIFPKLGVSSIWKILLPHLSLIFGIISWQQCFAAFVLIGSVTTLVFITYLVGAQAFCLYRGQTRVEYLMDIHAFNLGLKENLRQSLGSYWPLIFLSPFLPSPLPSDGTMFTVREGEKLNKNVKYL